MNKLNKINILDLRKVMLAIFNKRRGPGKLQKCFNIVTLTGCARQFLYTFISGFSVLQ